jgi:CheY-like chemotaxis protein
MSSEKRVYQRLIIDRPAWCRLAKTSMISLPVVIVDIGPEGLAFLIDEALEIGRYVYFDIDLGNGILINLGAYVRWSEPVGVAKRFRVGAKIFEVDKADLENFVRYYCEQLLPVTRTVKKILVVEDEIDMANLLRVELNQNGYDVVCAHDGEDGFSKYLSERPDLIILDIMLPKLNGYEVCRKIRREQDDSHTPIIMLTAKKGDVDKIVGGVMGAQRYMTKPFEAEHLLNEIKELLSLSQT